MFLGLGVESFLAWRVAERHEREAYWKIFG
jgi:hypothetical protein